MKSLRYAHEGSNHEVKIDEWHSNLARDTKKSTPELEMQPTYKQTHRDLLCVVKMSSLRGEGYLSTRV